MDKIKSTLIQIIDFIICGIVLLCALYGTAIFIKNLFNLDYIDSVCIIISFLMVGRFTIKISNK